MINKTCSNLFSNIFFLFLFLHLGFSQSFHRVSQVEIPEILKEVNPQASVNKVQEILLEPVRSPFALNHGAAFISLAIRIDTFSNGQIWLRKKGSSNGWESWQLLKAFHEKSPYEPAFVSELLYLRQNEQSIQAKIVINPNKGNISKQISFHFFLPQKQPSPTPMSTLQDSCYCPSPGFINRSGWDCPDGQTPSCSSPVSTSVSHLIIHHSAGINQSNDWGAIVLSIWDFHVRTNNWCDIGYNWLIDPNGKLYQGRGGNGDIRGAHFCGKNSGTMGVCLLGNFEIATPTEAALQTLDSLLSWKSCEADLSPSTTDLHASSGKTLPVIAGHKDGCGTICPGANLYPLLSSIRTETQTLLDACSLVSNLDPSTEHFSFKLFPNPNKGNFQIEFQTSIKGTYTLRMIDFLGREIYRQNLFLPLGGRQQQLIFNDISSGNYTFIVSREGLPIQYKIVQIQP